MTRRQETPAREGRVILALAVAGLAAAAALTWSGMAALDTVRGVTTGSPGVQVSPAAMAAHASDAAAPANSVSDHATTHASGTAATNAAVPKHQPLANRPAGPKASPGSGNAPEVSLTEAGRGASGAAASKLKGGNSTGLKRRGAVDPTTVLSDRGPSLGGCLPQYGAAGQCLPVVPPSLSQHLKEMKDAGLDPGSMPHVWTCTEVRTYFKNGIIVRQSGVDPQKLDANADGIACGPAD